MKNPRNYAALPAQCLLLVMLIALPAFAGGKPADAFAPATYVTTAEIEAALKEAPAGGLVYDKVIKTVDEGGYKVSIVILRRTPKAGTEDRGLEHEKVTEVYQIISGSGTMETGGTMANTSPVDLTLQAAGPSVRGDIQGGEKRHMGPGDVVVILPHVPHRFSSLEGTITYLVTRIELTSK
jgi:mannose-6-phosphate isomerase-like protein (cupin superfamily)